MCGFAGILNSRTRLDNGTLAKYSHEVSFRGPDSCGIRILNDDLRPTEQGPHALFFNRLAIVDLDARSDQPFEDERYLLTFNGEIYNYHELKESLKRKGIVFKTTSDTEVLFFLLREYGVDGIERLNGMFSFFWLDKHTRKFIVARDRLGIKPLYYSISGNTFCYGSELNSILRLMNNRPAINKTAVEMYLWMQFVPTPYSIFEGICKLPPGNYISAGMDHISADIQPIAYWNAYDEANFVNKNTGDFESLLRDSVERQLQADVPLGLFLSSGVDSSLLAALVNKYHAKDQDVNFFTVSFEENTPSNESAEAMRFISGFNNPNLKTHMLQISPRIIQNHLDNLYDYVDEPFGDSAVLLNWAISAKAKEYVTVALSGDGADELFWGYPRYNKWKEIKKLNAFPAISKIISKSSAFIPSFTVRNKLQRVFDNHPVKRHFDLFIMPGFRQILTEHITNFPMWATEGVEVLKNKEDLPSILDIRTYLADAMLYKVDRASMAASLEVRVPYLDNKIVDYALALDFRKKSGSQFTNKEILKKLLMRLAPHYNIYRPKKGFNFPKKKWLKEHWKEQVLSSVNAQTLSDLGLDPQPFISLVKNFYEKDGNEHVEVWYLFNLVLWKQRFDRTIGQTS